MNLEIWFGQPTEASVFLESSVADEEEQFYETSLFALYASRQIANLRGDGASLSYVLSSTDTDDPLRWTRERVEGVSIASPQGRGGRKGFTCEFRPEKRGFFKLHTHGFGMMGRGVGYYAPTSTLVLLHWLLERRSDDPAYQRALSATAENVGIAGMQGMISITSQAQVAMQAAAEAWGEAAEVAQHLVNDEPSAEVLAACRATGINYGLLVAGASGRLEETLSRVPDEGGRVVAFPPELAIRNCRVEVVAAADLTEEESIDRAFAAVQAAEATGDDEMIRAGYAHYDRALADVIDENGLVPVVEALHQTLFTDSPDEASDPDSERRQDREDLYE